MTNVPPSNDDEKSKSALASPDWPSHCYWMYDENGEYIHKYDYGMAEHPDCEFLDGTDYEDMWAQQFFWSADQAAALSFGRSPDEVPYDAHMESMDQSSRFATYFCDLREHIIEAQRDRILPERIPAVMYAQWAQQNGLPFPPELAKQVSSFFADVMAMTNERATSLTADTAVSDTPASTLPQHAKASPRQEKNLKGVIYALAWRHHRLGDLPETGVAANIEKVIDEMGRLNENFGVEGKKQRIADWLRETIELYGRPQKYET
jgi:hypothetical protein